VIVHRGDVWRATIPGVVGRKYILVVSAEALNRALSYIIGARITSVERERSLPTWVAIPPGEVIALPALSFVICHDLFLLDKDPAVLAEQVGRLPAARLLEVEAALRNALDLG
jgi:mRNA-degrading endonuclease toxin of MazEF toxin-antitoxin module